MGKVELAGSLDSGGVRQFGRVLRNPAVSADGLCRTLVAVLGAGNWPAGALTDLTLTVSKLSSETGRQSGLWIGTKRPTVPDVPGVERLAAVDIESPLPERRWAIGRSLRPLSVPEPAVGDCVAGVPRGVQTDGETWRAVDAVADIWDVETAWWTDRPEHRR